jgi:hypothetical protein
VEQMDDTVFGPDQLVTVPPRGHSGYSATVIFIHVSDSIMHIDQADFKYSVSQGLGQSNLTWKIVVVEALAKHLPHVRWILPQA